MSIVRWVFKESEREAWKCTICGDYYFKPEQGKPYVYITLDDFKDAHKHQNEQRTGDEVI